MIERASIDKGDTVRVEFWPMVNDVVGTVRYCPSGAGDSWSIKEQETGMTVYVMHFARMTRIASAAEATGTSTEEN